MFPHGVLHPHSRHAAHSQQEGPICWPIPGFPWDARLDDGVWVGAWKLLALVGFWEVSLVLLWKQVWLVAGGFGPLGMVGHLAGGLGSLGMLGLVAG